MSGVLGVSPPLLLLLLPLLLLHLQLPQESLSCIRLKTIHLFLLLACGVKKVVRVVGGDKAEVNEYPWMALLRLKSQGNSGFFCGGSLISSRWILTAQHCIFSQVTTGGTTDIIT